VSALVPRSDGPIPTFSVVTSSPSPRLRAERLAHPAGRGRPARSLSLDALEVIAIGLAQSSPGIGQVWTQGTRRRYARLLGTALYDAWLIEWLPSSGLQLHDHGGSRGVVVVAAGHLVETYTDLRRRHPLRTQIVNGGQSLTMPPTRVHELSNPGPADALSINVYSPPLRELTFFDRRPRSFLTPLFASQGDLAVLEEATT
jgi:Cysteine dioxygenase type I